MIDQIFNTKERAGIRALVLAIMLLASLYGCTSTPTLYHTPPAQNSQPEDLAWIVSPRYTLVKQIDGHEIPGSFQPFAYEAQVGSWIAVAPGKHTLMVRYATATRSAAALSEVVVESFAGKTNYIYGRIDGGVRYFSQLIDQPADAALIKELNETMF